MATPTPWPHWCSSGSTAQRAAAARSGAATTARRLAAELRGAGYRVLRRVVYAAEPAPALTRAGRGGLAGRDDQDGPVLLDPDRPPLRAADPGRGADHYGTAGGRGGYLALRWRGIRGSALAARPRGCPTQPGRDACIIAMSDPAAQPGPNRPMSNHSRRKRRGGPATIDQQGRPTRSSEAPSAPATAAASAPPAAGSPRPPAALPEQVKPAEVAGTGDAGKPAGRPKSRTAASG